MQKGLEVSGPAAEVIVRSAAFAIRVVSVSLSVWLVVRAVRWW